MADFIKTSEIFKKKLVNINETDEALLRPLTKEGVERFSLWDNQEKKFIPSHTKEGDENTITIGDRTLKVNKYIALTDEDKRRFQRNQKIRRNIIFNGNEYVYDMPLSMNDALEQAMLNLEAADVNPLERFYKVTKKKTGAEAFSIEYSVVATKETPTTTQATVVTSSNDSLSESEQQAINVMKQQVPDWSTQTTDMLVSVLESHGIKDLSRAREVVLKYLR